MFDKINIVIVLIAAITVTIFGLADGKSLLDLAKILIFTILIFSVMGFWVKKSLIKWFEKDDEEDETEFVEDKEGEEEI